MIDKLKRPELWTISVQLLVVYVVVVVLFYALDFLWRKIALAEKTPLWASPIASFVVGGIGVATLVVLCRKLGVEPRLAMVLVPLALLLERRANGAKAAPHQKRLQLWGGAGLVAGIGAATFALMRAAPWT